MSRFGDGLASLDWSEEIHETEGDQILEAVAVAKVLRADGEIVIRWGYTDGTTAWESLGMIEAAAANLRAAMTVNG